MTARAETITAAVTTLLTGLATTGANVQRGQVYPHEADKLPALSVFMGDDVIEMELQTAWLDWQLTILVETTVKVTTDYTTYQSLVDQQLNAIREEVHAALLANHTLGLAYVHDIEPISASRPRLSGEGDTPMASQVLTFNVKYRTSRADISA